MAAYQLTLTTADTNYNALTLVRAEDATLVDGFTHVVIQADADNAAGIIRVGRDANLADDRFGYRLYAGDGQTYPASSRKHTLKGLYFRPDTNGLKVTIDLTR